jgi:hypothetical protein
MNGASGVHLWLVSAAGMRSAKVTARRAPFVPIIHRAPVDALHDARTCPGTKDSGPYAGLGRRAEVWEG